MDRRAFIAALASAPLAPRADDDGEEEFHILFEEGAEIEAGQALVCKLTKRHISVTLVDQFSMPAATDLWEQKLDR